MPTETNYLKYSISCLIAVIIISIGNIVLDGMQYHHNLALWKLSLQPPRMEHASQDQAVARIEEDQSRIQLRMSVDASTLFLGLLGLWCATRKGKSVRM